MKRREEKKVPLLFSCYCDLMNLWYLLESLVHEMFVYSFPLFSPLLVLFFLLYFFPHLVPSSSSSCLVVYFDAFTFIFFFNKQAFTLSSSFLSFRHPRSFISFLSSSWMKSSRGSVCEEPSSLFRGNQRKRVWSIRLTRLQRECNERRGQEEGRRRKKKEEGKKKKKDARKSSVRSNQICKNPFPVTVIIAGCSGLFFPTNLFLSFFLIPP